MLARGTLGTNVWGEGWGGELDYLCRVHVSGDQHMSLGLDLMAGVTLAQLRHNEQRLASGFHPGGNAGLSIDFRARNFIMSAGAQYRVLFPIESPAEGDSSGLAHVVTASLGAGFTFY